MKGAVIAPYEDLLDMVETLRRQRKWDLEIALGDLFEGVQLAKNFAQSGATFIVSRGGTFELIKRSLTIPVIEIKVETEDLLEELLTLRNFNGRIGLAGFENVVRGYRVLSKFAEKPLEYVTFDEPSNVRNLLAEAANRGVDLFLTDTIGTKVAKNLGLTARLIRSSPRAVTEAIELALHLTQKQFEGTSLVLGRSTLRTHPSTENRPNARYTFRDILFQSPVMAKIVQQAKIYSSTDSPVLITGETGTGKELFAHSIHQESRRSGGPFIVVSCGSIPASLLAAELMGYEAGAFTSARREGRTGLFEAANGGTIFLDEIQDLPLDVQGTILRFLQEGEIRKLGQNRTLKLDVRVIAATNQDLGALVEAKRFREDLYYRLNVLNLTIPPLRERKEDISLLAQHFVANYARQFRVNVTGLSKDAHSLLLSYHFPGNVRELQSIIQRAVLVAQGQEIQPTDLDLPAKKVVEASVAGEKERRTEIRPLKEMERQLIIQAYQEAGGDLGEAAEKLGISRTTLWRKLKAYSVSSP